MECDGRLMARAKTTALTKRIDDMLDSWEQYAREKEFVCSPCQNDNHHRCVGIRDDGDCDCVCNVEEGVVVYGR